MFGETLQKHQVHSYSFRFKRKDVDASIIIIFFTVNFD